MNYHCVLEITEKGKTEIISCDVEAEDEKSAVIVAIDTLSDRDFFAWEVLNLIELPFLGENDGENTIN